MNTFKRKALFTAVLAGLGTAGTAEAVYLNPNGTGQALVYPYYTTQSSNGSVWNTYLSVVNTTSRGKVVKVRFLEGRTSAEVLDFNLFLSPNDVWTAAIIPSGTDAAAGARVLTADNSCTNPVGNLPIANGGEPFRNSVYTVEPESLVGTGLDRTREGYVEILEMGTVPPGALLNAISHNSAGIPNNCSLARSIVAPAAGVFTPPSGGLMGTGTLINVATGLEAGYKAEALEAWRQTTLFTDPGSTAPSLAANAQPAISVVVNAGGLNAAGASVQITAYRTDFSTAPVSASTQNARAVASVFMHTEVLNEYTLDTATASLTDWVITHPTKREFVVLAPSTDSIAPFSNRVTESGSCETFSMVYFNREEAAGNVTTADFSPAGNPLSLCYEANVISFRNGASHMPSNRTPSAVLGSINGVVVDVTGTFQNGWADLAWIGTNANPANGVGMGGVADVVRLDTASLVPATLTPAVPVTFFGLPSIGFRFSTFKNNQVTCTTSTGGTAPCTNSYGQLFNHSYRNVIVP